MARSLGLHHEAMTLGTKFRRIIWSLVLLLAVTATVGFAMQYSAANGNFDPWAWRQAARAAEHRGQNEHQRPVNERVGRQAQRPKAHPDHQQSAPADALRQRAKLDAQNDRPN